jgi:hypothetical protein
MSKNDPHYAPEPPEHPDQWHRHTPDEGRPQTEHAPQADPYILGAVGAVITVGFVALLIVVTLYYFQYTTKVRNEKIETTLPSAESYAYRDNSLERINQGSYVWSDLEGGSQAVQIPIDQAIEKVLAEYGTPRGGG